MRVLVVDDSAFMRRAISQMLAGDPDLQVVGTGRHGREAVALARQLRPDVITLDIEMPEMDGLTALRQIMRECPTQVLMFSSLTTEGSRAALQALHWGAADVLAKDVSQVSLVITDLRDDLIARVRALGGGRRRRWLAPPGPAAAQPVPVFRPGQFDVVCIGSSTGGPPALEQILPALPAGLSAPVVIAQHMPELFTRSMSERLAQVCPLRVVHAENGLPLQKGHIYVAPGGRHLHLLRVGLARYELRVSDQPREAPYRPSVDALFASAAAATRSRTLAVVLTGMGTDGLQGARTLRDCGGVILAQNEETCVVYGMPKAVTENALIAASLSPRQITQALRTLAPIQAARAAG